MTASKPGFNPALATIIITAGEDLPQDLRFATVSDTSGTTVNDRVAGSPAMGYYVPNAARSG